MFLKNYVLANEFLEKSQIKSGNIGNIKRELEKDYDFSTMKKLGNVVYIKKDSLKLPLYFRKHLSEEYINTNNMLPVSYLKESLGLSEKLCKILLLKLPLKVEIIFNKRMAIFTDDFVKELTGKIPYILNEQETFELMKSKDINGYIKLDKKHYFTWYSVL